MCYLSIENKDTDQLRSHCEADLRLCFRIGKNPVFSRCDPYYITYLSTFSLLPKDLTYIFYSFQTLYARFVQYLWKFIFSVKCKVLAALGWIGTMCIYGSILFIILKELK